MIYLNKKYFIKSFVLILPIVFIANIKANKETIIQTSNQKTISKLLEDEKFKSNFKDLINNLIKKHAHHWADFAARMNSSYDTLEEEVKNAMTQKLLDEYKETFPDVVFDRILESYKKNNSKKLTKQQLNELEKEITQYLLEIDAFNLIKKILLENIAFHGDDKLMLKNNQIVLEEKQDSSLLDISISLTSVKSIYSS